MAAICELPFMNLTVRYELKIEKTLLATEDKKGFEKVTILVGLGFQEGNISPTIITKGSNKEFVITYEHVKNAISSCEV
jgi:hypothetical protein